MTGLPSSRDQLGWVPHASRYAGNRLDDLAVEVEAEVVARREVGEPVVADPDHAAVDLVDDRVHHRVRRLERLEVAAGVEPVLDPRPAAPPQRRGSGRGRAGTGDGRAKAHDDAFIGLRARRLEDQTATKKLAVDEWTPRNSGRAVRESATGRPGAAAELGPRG